MLCPMRPPAIKPAAPPISAPTPALWRSAKAPMAAPDTPPISAPLAVLSGRPLGVVHPASRLAKLIAIAFTGPNAFMIHAPVDVVQLVTGPVAVFVVGDVPLRIFVCP